MTHPAFDVEHELRCHGDALRALAGALVRDPNVADDAVQEVWLAALQLPPRHRESLGGWFATALHNVLRMWRRGERRREQREQIVRSRGGVDRGDAIAREERGRQLLTAVQSLEQPFRDAIWHRFFEGKAPREIAAAIGVPVATVKSRLQRGLGMLRVRLDEKDGDWRAGFVTAFGFGSEGTAVAIAAGGIVMATWVKVTGGALAAAAAFAVWVSWPDPKAPVTTEPTGSDTASVATAASLERASAPGDATPRTDATPERTTAPARVDPKLATIRGRCVDQHGNPLAGCRALLNGWQRNQELLDAWLRDHPKVDWENPPRQPTGADGVFSFTFWPPPPFQFAMGIDGDGLAGVGARWKEIAEGRTVDFGDVVMVPGVLVQGRVVDDAGAPIVDASVGVWLGAGEPAGETETLTFEATTARSGADGSFRCYSSVRPGPFRAVVIAPDGRQLPNPFTGTLTRERPVEDIVLVLARPTKESTITGRVVDQRGQPIHGASIEAREQRNGWVGSADTQRDGTFVMERRSAGSVDSPFLSVAHPRFEFLRTEREVAWGSTEVVLTMQAAGGLAVYVRDDEGTAITDFTVRVIQMDSLGLSLGRDDVRARPPYADGFAMVPCIPRGRCTLLVEFPTAMQRASVAVPIEKTASDTLRVDVTSHPNVRRTIRIVDAKNEPVTGARLRLCMSVERLFGDGAGVSPLVRLSGDMSGGPMRQALFLMEGTTGADGSLVVTGPRRQPLGVCVRGPEHLPLYRGDVLLDDETPLVISVEKGARLYGVLRPAAVLPTLQRLRGKQPLLLQVHSASPQQRTQLVHWFETEFPIGADGAFDCRGLEPGEWSVELGAGCRLNLGQVTLRSDESTQLDPDLGYLQTGTLRGTLHKNGPPMRDAAFRIDGAVPGPFAYVDTQTDAAGRFEVQVGAGAYGAMLYGGDRSGAADAWGSLERATVVAGATTEQDFHIWTGDLNVVVRDAAGAPVPKLRILATSAGERRTWLPASDSEGATTAEVQAEPHTFAVPKPAPGSQGTEPDFVTLGTATVVTGKPTTVELRLPAAWDTK